MATIVSGARITITVDGVAIDVSQRDLVDWFDIQRRQAATAWVRHEHDGRVHEHVAMDGGRLGPARPVRGYSFTVTAKTEPAP